MKEVIDPTEGHVGDQSSKPIPGRWVAQGDRINGFMLWNLSRGNGHGHCNNRPLANNFCLALFLAKGPAGTPNAFVLVDNQVIGNAT